MRYYVIVNNRGLVHRTATCNRQHTGFHSFVNVGGKRNLIKEYAWGKFFEVEIQIGRNSLTENDCEGVSWSGDAQRKTNPKVDFNGEKSSQHVPAFHR